VNYRYALSSVGQADFSHLVANFILGLLAAPSDEHCCPKQQHSPTTDIGQGEIFHKVSGPKSKCTTDFFDRGCGTHEFRLLQKLTASRRALLKTTQQRPSS